MKISVIIPTYNRSGVIERAIGSALDQTFKPHEIIVVDDGSWDSTAAKVNSYGSRVKYIYRENSGKPGIARNMAFKQVCGDWVAFLDSDDSWKPNKLERQKQLIEDADVRLGLVFSDYFHIDSRNQAKRSTFSQNSAAHCLYLSQMDSGVIFNQKAFYHHLLYNNPIHTSTVLLNRELIDVTGGFCPSLTIAEDRDLWIRCAKLGHVGYIPDVLCNYYVGEDSITKRKILYLQNLSSVIRRHYLQEREHIPDHIKAEIDSALGRMYRRLSIVAANGGQKSQSLRAMKSSFKYVKADPKYLLQVFAILISPWLYEFVRNRVNQFSILD